MRTQLTAEFTALANAEGTFQNTSRHAAIEIATSTTKNTGIILNAQEAKNIKSDATLYARVIEDISDNTETVYLAHEPFKGTVEGGDSRDSRKPSTAYDAGALVDGAGLKPGLALRCTTAGTTSSAALDCSSYGLGDTITDGTAVWLVTEYVTLDEAGGIPTNIYIPGAFNKKVTFTSSGSFTAPVTGVYRITLQGGGGGGGGTTGWSGGGGGGSGAKIETYERLIAGVSYSYTVADRTSAASSSSNGDNGGDTSITVNNNAYIAGGGYGGYKGTATAMGCGGQGGKGTINEVLVSVGAPGGSPNIISGGLGVASSIIHGGPGGGDGGGQIGFPPNYPYPVGVSTNGVFGGGGQGGSVDGNTASHTANRGGAGYISFEYYNPTA